MSSSVTSQKELAYQRRLREPIQHMDKQMKRLFNTELKLERLQQQQDSLGYKIKRQEKLGLPVDMLKKALELVKKDIQRTFNEVNGGWKQLKKGN